MHTVHSALRRCSHRPLSLRSAVVAASSSARTFSSATPASFLASSSSRTDAHVPPASPDQPATSLASRLRGRRLRPEPAAADSASASASASASTTTSPPPAHENPPHLADALADPPPVGNLTRQLDQLINKAITDSARDPREVAEERRQAEEEHERVWRLQQERKKRVRRRNEHVRNLQRQTERQDGPGERRASAGEDEQSAQPPEKHTDDELATDLRRRMGFSNPGKIKRDAKRALRAARLASGGQLTQGEKAVVKQLEVRLLELRHKRRRMLPWNELSNRLKKLEIYRLERRIQRDEKHLEEKVQKAEDRAAAGAREEVEPAQEGSFDAAVSEAAPSDHGTLPSPSPPSAFDTAPSPSSPAPIIPTSAQLAKHQVAKLKREIYAETARKAWAMRRSNIDQEILELEAKLATYSPAPRGTKGPPAPNPPKRTEPPLLNQFVEKLTFASPYASSDASATDAPWKRIEFVEGADGGEPGDATQMTERVVGSNASELGRVEGRGRLSRRKQGTEPRPYASHPALRRASSSPSPPRTPPPALSAYQHVLSPSSVPFAPTPSPLGHVPIATLSHSLTRALFNPGVHFLRDPRSGVYNFPPDALEHVPKVSEFDFGKLPQYITSSKDEVLKELAEQEGRMFAGSTSSVVGMLCQIYFWLNKGKEVNLSMLSESYQQKDCGFSMGQRLPVSIVLNYRDGRYAIDADKSFDMTTDSNILADYGHLMEKLLTTEANEFKRFLIDAEDPAPSEADHRQAYHYALTEHMVLRSQLDAHNQYLPGNGTFDLKTRGTVAIRQDRLNYEESAGYTIDRLRGEWESFEREYYDLIRSAFLKYQFQARIGCMDGVFVAYHSTARFYGFQYVPIAEMDEALFHTPETGDQAFKLSLGVLETVLQEAAGCYPGESVNVTWAADPAADVLRVFVAPQREVEMANMPEENGTDDSSGAAMPELAPTPTPSQELKKLPMTLLELRGTNYLDGEAVDGPVVVRPTSSPASAAFASDVPVWQVGFNVTKSTGDDVDLDLDPAQPSAVSAEQIARLFADTRQTQKMFSTLMLPTGVSAKDVRIAAERAKEAGVELDPSDLSVRFPIGEGIAYRGPSMTAKVLRRMSRKGTEKREKDLKNRVGEKMIVVRAEVEAVEVVEAEKGKVEGEEGKVESEGVQGETEEVKVESKEVKDQ
ncbi:hypothetical protein JCM21900_004983 [Sporobolomyces salmonicolor]